jgi:futalosine hydrolase
MSVLLVVATPQEAEFFGNLGVRVVVSGIGAVNAALSTYEAVLEDRPRLIVNVGIGGAYPNSGLKIGETACSSAFIYAGLGAQDGEGFLDLEQLDFPLLPDTFNRIPAWDGAGAWSKQLNLRCGEFLTLETVTGNLETLGVLEKRFPDALMEGMEGAGVAHAALKLGIPALELRGVSNFVGLRDRSSWRIRDALASCRNVLERGLPLLDTLP